MKKWKIISAVLGGLLIVAAVTVIGLFASRGNGAVNSATVSSSSASQSSSQQRSTQQSPQESSSSASAEASETSAGDLDEIRGMWVATVMNLDFPNAPDESAAALEAELDGIVDSAAEWGFNAIFFQVRPAADALYKSALFPVSAVLSSSRELPDGFDPLAYLIEQAHGRGIQVHAWVNPLRITTGSAGAPQHDISALPDGHPAKSDEYDVVAYADGRLYFDPGDPDVRRLVIDGIAEITENYDVDGIHMDDYFYPYPVAGAQFDDGATYEEYGASLDRGDWRRQNINEMISGIYTTVKAKSEDLVFGVAPFAIWRNYSDDIGGSQTRGGIQTYSDLYADTLLWVGSGWLDYICPQIYWATDQTGVEFGVVYDWWASVCRSSGVALLAGHAAYKTGNDEYGWADGQEIARQMDYVMGSGCYNGSIFFRYKFLVANPMGVTDGIAQIYANNPIGAPYLSGSDQYGQPNLIGTDNNGKILLAYGSYSTGASWGSVIGAANPSLPLYCNGDSVPLTEKGFFSIYRPLGEGKNTLSFTQGDAKASCTITRTVSGGGQGLIYADVWPETDNVYKQSGSMEASIYVNRECVVIARYGGESVTLVPEKSGYGWRYSGVFSPMPVGNGPVSYDIMYGDESGTAVSKGSVMVLSKSDRLYLEVVQECSVIKHDNNTNVARWNVPVPTGTLLEAEGLENGYCILSDFGYILEECVHRTTQAPGESFISGAGMSLRDGRECFSIRKTGSSCVDIEAYKNALRVIAYGRQSSVLGPLSLATRLEHDNVSARVYRDRVEYMIDLGSQEQFRGFYVLRTDDGVDIVLKGPSAPQEGDLSLSGMRVALNLGHGPRSGAVGPMGYSGWIEDEFNNDIVQRTKDLLEAMGATVVLVSTMEEPLQIDEVVEDYEAGDFDIAVSVHFNAVAQSSNAAVAKGTTAYYAYPNARLLAQCLLDSVCEQTGLDSRGVVRDSFRVTRTYTCPSVLMEMAFICNPAEYDWMCTDANRAAMARGLVLGIEEYLTGAEE